MSYKNLKKMMDNYNWDDGFAYLDNFEMETSLKEWEQFTVSLYNDILCGRYIKDSNPYEIPLSNVEKYKLKKKQVPEIFLTDL